MWINNDSSDAISYFWECAGELEDFPRSLERPLAVALPVALVKLPKLTLHDIETWLRLRSIPFSFRCNSRAVRGCLVAFGGKGLIFLDGSDPIDEQRFSLAHEIAHFLIDYWKPRQKAISKLGNDISNVFDGHRSPTVNERLYAVLSSTNLGIYIDVMERGSKSEAEIWRVENQADKVALVLLAPPDIVLKISDLSSSKFDERLNSITRMLTMDFGLPKSISKLYGIELLNTVGKGRSWVEAIRHP
jgi:hypothetical protein